MNVVLAVLLAISVGADTGGRLFVRIVPGYEVIVDGVSAGLSSADEGGATVPNLGAGAHKVTVRSSDGREGSFAVSIVEGQTTSIDVSPLGLRKKLTSSAADEQSMVSVICIPEGCSAQFRGATANATQDDIAFNAVPAGTYPISVSHGKSTLRNDVVVPTGSIVTVQADFTNSKIQTIETRRRPRKLQVAEANDALTPLPVPAFWKTAIRGVLPSGALVVDAAQVAGNGVKVSVRVSSGEVGFSLIESLVNSHQFAGISVGGQPRKTQNGWEVDFVFYFAATR